MFERIGLGAVLTFAEQQATAAMARARQGIDTVKTAASRVPPALNTIGSTATKVFNQMSTSAQRVSAGISSIQSGMMQTAMGLGAVTLGVGAGAKMFADFEQQMSVVKSVTNFTGASFDQLTSKAKELGATTAFTATEAAQGMEMLGRAGFTAGEQMEATRHALNLAAADSIELSSSSDILAQVLRGMNIPAAEAGRVADVLAKTSASANTNVISLGESFKMGSATANQMGVSLEETSAIFAVMADGALRGTLAGTSFTNMMIQLSKPSQKSQELMKKLNLQVVRYKDQTTGAIKIDFPKTIESISQALLKIPDPLERAGAAAEIFGLRGQKAANAFLVAGATKLTTLTDSLKNAEGHAQAMADMRLDNFKGQITLLTSAIEGFAIEMFQGVMNPMTKMIKDEIIPQIMDVVAVFQVLNKSDPWSTEDIEKLNKAGPDVINFVKGIQDGIKFVQEAFKAVIDQIKEWSREARSTFGEDFVRKLGKVITIIALVAAAVTPLILAFMMAGLVISGLVTMISGIASVVSGAFLPVLAIVAALGLAFLFVRGENESFGDTVTRVWANIKAWALDVWENVLKPFWQGVKDGYELHWPMLRDTVTNAFGVIKEAIAHVYALFAGETPQVATDWRMVGTQVVGILAGIIETIAKVIMWIVLIGTTAIRVGRQYFLAVMDTFLAPFVAVYNLIADVITALGMFASGDIIGGLKKFGTAILNFMLEPLRFVLRQIVRLADAINEDLVPQNIRDFANEGVMQLQMLDTAPTHTSGERGAPAFLEKKESVMDADSELRAAQMRAAEDAGDAMNQALIDALSGKIDQQTAAVAEAASTKPCIDNYVDVNLDGEKVARNTARHNQEISDRAGFKTTPYQRRVAVEQGAVARK